MRSFAFVALLLSSLSSFAADKSAPVWPRVFNFGNALQVEVQNTTDKDINCSGSVYAYLSNGQMQSFFFYEFISAGSFVSRYYSIYQMNTRITNSNHSIFCYER